MELKDIMKSIREECQECKECDPSCTGNLLLKCIENDRLVYNV